MNIDKLRAIAEGGDLRALDRLWDGLAKLNDSNNPAWLGLTHVKNRLAALEAELDAGEARVVRLEEHLTCIADLPDPGEETERSATFYRIHIGHLKQIAAKGLGRQTVSDEAMAWACSPEVIAEIEAARAALAKQEPGA